MVLLLRKLYLYFTKDPKAVHYFPGAGGGGGYPTFSRGGGGGGGGNMSGSRNFCQFYLVLSLFYSLKRGSNGFIAEKTILIFYKGPKGHYFPGAGGGGGIQLFPGGGGGGGGGGPNANFYRNPYTYLLFSRGNVRTPYPPLDPQLGNVIVRGQYLSQSGL